LIKVLVNDGDCTFKHEDKEFTSGGAYIAQCSDLVFRGVVYVSSDKKTVKTWPGEIIAPIDRLTNYQGNFCKMCRVTFTLKGIKFTGDYCPDWADAVKVRSTKAYTHNLAIA